MYTYSYGKTIGQVDPVKNTRYHPYKRDDKIPSATNHNIPSPRYDNHAPSSSRYNMPPRRYDMPPASRYNNIPSTIPRNDIIPGPRGGCFICGDPSHFKRECPNKRMRSNRNRDMHHSYSRPTRSLNRNNKSDFGIKRGQQGFNLRPIDWSKIELKSFKKNFWNDMKDSCKIATQLMDLKVWRHEKLIKVFSGYKDIINNDRKRVGYESINGKWNLNDQYINNNDYSNDLKDKPQKIPVPIMNFFDAKFPSFLMNNIIKAGFKEPTPIQSQAWSMALTGSDLVGIAQTGSGKTLAFLFPAIIHLLDQPRLEYKDGPIALVIAPTRELAIQIEGETRKFCQNSRIRYGCVYGGAPKRQQQIMLEKGCEILIATPGRLLDFIEKGVLSLSRCTYLVVDEADRLLDMGFEPQLLAINNQIRPDRQIVMFSATWPKQVITLAKKFLTKSNNIFQVIIGGTDLNCNKNVKQHIRVLQGLEKIDALKLIIHDTFSKNKNGKILVFVKTRKSVDWLMGKLRREGFYASGIHGDKSQVQRDRAIYEFKHGYSNILLATDVASRGIHIDNINVVINFDFPQQIEDYVHRIGRTGRVQQKGEAYSFLTDEDAPRAKQLIALLKDNNQKVGQALYDLWNKKIEQTVAKRGRGRGRGRGSHRFSRRG